VLLVLLGSAVLVMLRPSITPDHPWADRRLVPAALPVVVLAAVAGTLALVRLARSAWPPDRSSGPRERRIPHAVAGVCGVALLLPTVLATAPLLPFGTEAGELGAVRAVCRQLRPTDVAFLLDLRARREWSQPLRASCGVPAVGVLDRTALPRLMARARAAGRTPVLVAGTYPQRIRAAGLVPTHAVHLVTQEDRRLLHRLPHNRHTLVVDLWLSTSGSATSGSLGPGSG
jgi:hypothetical protein